MLSMRPSAMAAIEDREKRADGLGSSSGGFCLEVRGLRRRWP